MKQEILKKYLNNSCSREEISEVIDWIKTGALSKEALRCAFEEWISFNSGMEAENSKERYQVLLDKIHHEINIKSNRNFVDWPTGKIGLWFGRVASILFLPLLGGILFLLFPSQLKSGYLTDLTVDSLEVIAPVGSRTVVQLSDGTRVNLNYGSKIKYPRTFSKERREISLEGQGYFEVVHNSEWPFIVKTRKLEVKALGTEFDVQAYPEEEVVATTLVKGKVVVEKMRMGKKNSTPVKVMTPGQHLSYHSGTDQFSSTEGNTEKYTAWTEGKLVFDNESISQVAERLSRMFNVDIEVSDEIRDYSYTVTFVDDPLFLILDLMTEITPVTYVKYPRKKLPNGTFAKQKIRLEKRFKQESI